jgi:hypothetical protein
MDNLERDINTNPPFFNTHSVAMILVLIRYRSGIEYVYFNSLSTIQFVNRFSYSPSNINDILVAIIRHQFIFYMSMSLIENDYFTIIFSSSGSKLIVKFPSCIFLFSNFK